MRALATHRTAVVRRLCSRRLDWRGIAADDAGARRRVKAVVRTGRDIAAVHRRWTLELRGMRRNGRALSCAGACKDARRHGQRCRAETRLVLRHRRRHGWQRAVVFAPRRCSRVLRQRRRLCRPVLCDVVRTASRMLAAGRARARRGCARVRLRHYAGTAMHGNVQCVRERRAKGAARTALRRGRARRLRAVRRRVVRLRLRLRVRRRQSRRGARLLEVDGRLLVERLVVRGIRVVR
ncbi:hypothetical protein FA09DRAFT_11833 [Tilletiopsis washingtonensis]|uniref:Uncharacterized protein n=1 Tax=Tilletiopsis washingtonensis TaxID=58919 RepID=A0A316ZHX2_9BASI|nr:hypothetical protein FA09DRAFT_11833 [Tilletiopsis washingtonensis]PWO01361.1 hypothetical protein FA09DRAFT_11833 [Tilletiopsis washingtonensis]